MAARISERSITRLSSGCRSGRSRRPARACSRSASGVMIVIGAARLARRARMLRIDVGGVDALAQRLRAGRLDRRQPVAQHRGEDVDHLPVAVVGAGELAPDPLERWPAGPSP